MTVVLLPQADAERIAKLRGSGCYTADERFAGALRAVFVRSPHARARILRVDTAAADAMPGVVRVLTGQDCLSAGSRPFPVIDRIGAGLIIPPRPVMAAEEARHAGEAVACVVAETEAQAMDAAEAVIVHYEALPAVVGIEAALRDGAPLVHPATPGNLALRHHVGDAAAVAVALREAAAVVETRIDLPRLAPMTLEPRWLAGTKPTASSISERRIRE